MYLVGKTFAAKTNQYCFTYLKQQTGTEVKTSFSNIRFLSVSQNSGNEEMATKNLAKMASRGSLTILLLR